jgi:hypothetical protein
MHNIQDNHRVRPPARAPKNLIMGANPDAGGGADSPLPPKGGGGAEEPPPEGGGAENTSFSDGDGAENLLLPAPTGGAPAPGEGICPPSGIIPPGTAPLKSPDFTGESGGGPPAGNPAGGNCRLSPESRF